MFLNEKIKYFLVHITPLVGRKRCSKHFGNWITKTNMAKTILNSDFAWAWETICDNKV